MTTFSPKIYKTYFQRFKTKFFPYVIVVSVITFTSFKISESSLFLLFNFGFIIIWGILTHLIVRKSIISISINENHINISGENVNSKWNKTYELNNINIQIKSQGFGRMNVEYYLKISSSEEKFTVNKFVDWNYEDLIKIFELINKPNQNEGGENSKLLKFIKLKAKGHSSFDIAFKTKN